MTLPFAKFDVETKKVDSRGNKRSSDAKSVAKISIVANSDRTIDSYLSGLALYNTIFELWFEKYPADTISKIVNFILPAETIPRSLFEEALETGRARREIFVSGDLITAREWYDLAGGVGQEPDVWVRQYVEDKLIYSIRHAGIDYFPIYGLAALNNYQPIVILHQLIELFSAYKSGWDLAIWFSSPNTVLEGRAPKQLMESDPRMVLAAAMEDLSKLRHE